LPRRDSAARKISRCRAASSATTNIVSTTRSLNPFRPCQAGRMRLLGTSSTDNDAKLHSHAKQIRVSRIGLEDANSGRRAIRNNRAQFGGLVTKPALLQWTGLRTRRFGEDSFPCSFSNDFTPSMMLDARWSRRRMEKFRWRARPLQPVERAALLAPAAATAFSELLGLSPTIRSLRKHT